MQNDFGVIIGPSGNGLGFKNDKNFDKSFWVESTYSKDIFSHTLSEKKQVTTLYNKIAKRTLRG